MALESKQMRRRKVRFNSTNPDNPIVYQLVDNGEELTPTSATITIFKPTSTTAVLAATAMTVSGTLLTFNVDTTTQANFPADRGFRADLAITSGGVIYTRHFIFDVATYLLHLDVDKDQLVAMDDEIRDMAWDGDEDFSEIINACRNVIQTRIEAKVLGDNKLLETMILSAESTAVAFRFYVLSMIFRVKGDVEKATFYREEYNAIFDAVLSSLQYDKDEDGQEDNEIGGIQEVRLVT